MATPSQQRRRIDRQEIRARRRDNLTLFKQDKRANKLAIRRHGITGLGKRDDSRAREQAIGRANRTLEFSPTTVDPTRKINRRARKISAGFQRIEDYMAGKGSGGDKFNNEFVRAELKRIQKFSNIDAIDESIDDYLGQFSKDRMITSGQGVADAIMAVREVQGDIRDHYSVDFINETKPLELGAPKSTVKPTVSYTTENTGLSQSMLDAGFTEYDPVTGRFT